MTFEEFATKIEPDNYVTTEYILTDNAINSQQIAFMCMTYLVGMKGAGMLDNHPELKAWVNEYVAVANENAVILKSLFGMK